MQELSEATKKLVRLYKIAQQKKLPLKEVETIHVDEVAKKVAAFYEQIRTIVDWKEEHLMRRSSIIRKLKSKFFGLELKNFSETRETAEALVLELIRGGLFPNDKIEETKIDDVQKVISKYVYILQNNPENQTGEAGINFHTWLIEVAACEIEDTLDPAIKEMALIDYMFEAMKKKIKVSDKIFEAGILNKEDEDIQIYIAVCLALFKLDKPIISYNLIKYIHPNWKKSDEKLLSEMTGNAFRIYQEIEKNMVNPISNKFYAICEKYDTPYLLIGDVLSINDVDDTAQKISDPSVLERMVRESYIKRLATLKKRTSRAAIYSTVSIFVSKVLTLVLLEILIETYVGGGVSLPLLAADILIPTLLMFLIISSIKKPSKKNLNIVTMETMKIAYKNDGAEIYEIKTARKKGPVMKTILSFMYALSSVMTFGAIYYVLNYFHFSITSIFIDIIFIALILFSGSALSKRAQELTMEDEKEGFLSFVSDIFFLPMQGLGKWIATKWKRYNAIAAVFNALIDMPFSAFVEFIEKWRYFIKEQKEDIR